MQARLKVSPTKSALLAARRQLTFLQQGYELLDRKKELLTRLVHERLAQYRALREQARAVVADAYRALAVMQMRSDRRTLHQVAMGLAVAVQVQILRRSSLGVEYPAVTAEQLPLQPVGLLGTDASLDDARLRMAGMVVVLARLGEAETALWRLLEEQRKTQKRVNALRYNVIPRYRATIRYIEEAIEEEERSTLFQNKILMENESSGF